MASPVSAEAPSPTEDHSSYSDKQIASSIDHGKEVVTQTQPLPDAYAYGNPNSTNDDSTNDDSSNGGGGIGGLEVVNHLLPDDRETGEWSRGKSRRKICGLSSRALIIVIGVVTALLVAAIIGGSIGGVLANKDSSGNVKAESEKTSSTSSSAAISTAEATTSASAIAVTSEPATPTKISSALSTSATSSSSSSSSSSSLSTTTTTTTTSTAPTSAATSSTSGEGSYNCPADNNTNYVSPLLSTETWTILCNTDWPSGVDAMNGGSVVDLTAVIAYSIEACIDQCAAYNVAGGDCEAVVYGANITLALSRGGVQGNCFLKSDRGADNIVDNSGQVEAAYLFSIS